VGIVLDGLPERAIETPFDVLVNAFNFQITKPDWRICVFSLKANSTVRRQVCKWFGDTSLCNNRCTRKIS
jgi:hypothetical protein